jgi:hypothetical protein
MVVMDNNKQVKNAAMQRSEENSTILCSLAITVQYHSVMCTCTMNIQQYVPNTFSTYVELHRAIRVLSVHFVTYKNDVTKECNDGI